MRMAWLVILVGLSCTRMAAGPPFITDDPEPVEYRHWEFYVASEQQFEGSDLDATLPHVEVNYGAVPEVQLHLVAPMGYTRGGGESRYGYSATEVGVKVRFLDETERSPQVGVFPLAEVPIGGYAMERADRNVQVFLPAWCQKSWGNATTYGGGGFWYNPGVGKKNWLFAGWELQYNFSRALTIGGEAYYQTPDAADANAVVGIGAGGYFNMGEQNHILFSFGRHLAGDQAFTGYVGFLLTI